MNPALGLYLAIPFCRGKCTFCNFASDAFDPGLLPPYLDALSAEILAAPGRAARMGTVLPSLVDSVYLGGGTPSLLAPGQVDHLFHTLRATFSIAPDAEITVESAPGQLSADTLSALRHNGVNRISFGVQSFVDREAAAVGRRHTGRECLHEIDRVLHAGIPHVGVDLIAGLPHQTPGSWDESLAQLLSSGADHASIYLFEIDEDSRLGREVLEHGNRFSAAATPSDDLAAEMYDAACARLNAGGLRQYEISNFARPGCQSRHNLKYWHRQPYLGFGLDAHSMLHTGSGGTLRFSNTEDLTTFIAPPAPALPILTPSVATDPPHLLSAGEILEETLFLGLRLNQGIDLATIEASAAALAPFLPVLHQACTDGLLERDGTRLRLTARGRLLSNELFSDLLLSPAAA